MARILTTEISGTECIGDSRPKINTNFENLDAGIQTLSAFDLDDVQPVLTVVRANSASWEESSDILPTVTSYLSTNLVAMSSVNATGTFVIDTSSSNAALRVTQRGSGNVIEFEDDTNPDVTPFAITSVGQVLIGSLSAWHNAASLLITNSSNNSVIAVRTISSGVGPALQFHRARGSTSDLQILSAEDSLGNIAFRGYTGDNNTSIGALKDRGFRVAASINANVDGVPVLSSVPARLTFNTTLSGELSATERMRITHDGKIGIGTTAPNEQLTVVGGISATGEIRGIMPLSGHSDVIFTNLSGNQVLRFDGSVWRNHDNTAAQQLSGLTDIVFTYPILSGHVLRHNGTSWVNGFDLADVTDGLRNDVRVTGSGTVWTVTSGAITYDKLSNSTSPVSAGVKSRVAKAWLNYDGVNNVIRSSFNISSVTNLGAGYYKIIYTPGTFINNDYSFVATCDETYSAGPIGYYIWSQPTNFTLSSTEIKHRSYAAGTTETNPSILSVVVFASGN